MTCVVCGFRLTDIGAGLFRCEDCGYVYPAEIFADVDIREWHRIQTEGLACTECDQLLPGVPRIWVDRKGRAVACPEHAGRPSWWRWLKPRRLARR